MDGLKISPDLNGKIVPRDQHNLSRRNVNPYALKVLYRLREGGFKAYLVGGSVRDLLLNLSPKDFDVATDAHPEEIKKLFSNSRLIGRRFRIAHVFFGKEIIEVTTFRGAAVHSDENNNHANEHGILLMDNHFGSIEEDALRRDFTVNALYYNIEDFSVVDYAKGIEDLHQRVIRLIGTPEVRFREDPIRMLRAVRLAAKLNFELEASIKKYLPELVYLLDFVPKARLFDEIVKIIKSGSAVKTFELMLTYNLLKQIMPSVVELWVYDSGAEALAKQALLNTDQRIKEEKTINPGFMLAVLYWPLMLAQQKKIQRQKISKRAAVEIAINNGIALIVRELSIPRRLIETIRHIWYLQFRFSAPRTKRFIELLTWPKFRAAYDFLLLRAEIDPSLKSLATWWTEFYLAENHEKQIELLSLKNLKGT